MTTTLPPKTQLSEPVDGLYALPSTGLSFAPSLHVRSFLLPRTRGNIAVYGAPGVADLADVERRYLNHSHEAMFPARGADAPLFVHEADREAVEQAGLHVRATFSQRHMLDEDFEVIPIPGHTPGATAFLWDSGEHRFLFTGDTLYLRGGEWVAAVLGSSDRAAYVESLDLIRGLDFDVLVPWAADAAGPAVAHTDAADARRRVGAILNRVWNGEDH